MRRQRMLLVAVMWVAVTAGTATFWAGCGDDDDNGSNGDGTPVPTLPDGEPTATETPGECKPHGTSCDVGNQSECCSGVCVQFACVGD